jgi:hypothetical protein
VAAGLPASSRAGAVKTCVGASVNPVALPVAAMLGGAPKAGSLIHSIISELNHAYCSRIRELVNY